jgi:glutaminase
MDLSELPAIIRDCYEAVKNETSGKLADYIPQLAQVNPDLFGVGFCDVYGNKFTYGDSSELFCLQSSSKPLSYCLARTLEEELGGPRVHEHVGYEPSGRTFNEFCLNREGLPHNPLINAGAMMTASMIHPQMEPGMRNVI